MYRPTATQATGAGRVNFTIGNVTAESPDGSQRTLTRGSTVSPGDTIDTSNGRTQIRFTDGAYVSLKPKTRFKIDEYRYDGQPNGQEKGIFSLLRGGLRTVTGFIGRLNNNAYQVKTPVATIGIRGTAYTADLVEEQPVALLDAEDGGWGLTGRSAAAGDVSLDTTVTEGETWVCSNSGACQGIKSGQRGRVTKDGEIEVSGEAKESDSGGEPQETEEFIAGDDDKSLNPDSQLTSGRGFRVAFSLSDDGAEFPGCCADNGADSDVEASFLTTQQGSIALGFDDLTGDYFEAIGTPSSNGAIVEGGSIGFGNDGMGWTRWTWSGSATQHAIIAPIAPATDLPQDLVVTYEAQKVNGGWTATRPSSSSSWYGGDGEFTGGAIKVNFYDNQWDANWGVDLGGNHYAADASGDLIGTRLDDGFGSASSAGCSGACSTFAVGSLNATGSKAGLVYEISNSIDGDIHGGFVGVETGSEPAPQSPPAL